MFSVSDLLVLSQIPQLGPNRLRALVSHFGEPARVLDARAGEIAPVEGFNRRLACEVVAYLRSSRLSEAERFAEHQLSRINMIGGEILTFWDGRYPELLKTIYDPPPLLFIRGAFAEEDSRSIAVVGTRCPSRYGLLMAERFAFGLSRTGLTVVSGLARGIDTAAHRASLAACGRTIAVIGSGLDVIYPPENRGLSELISSHGVLVSEFPMGASPEAPHFPRRNRIISGLSLGTLVIESDLNGGAMITANIALDQGREVFSLPGEVTSGKSRGSNALIREGRAKLVDSVGDVLDEIILKLPLGTSGPIRRRKAALGLTLLERKLYDLMGEKPLPVDILADMAGLPPSDMLMNLLSLESKGLIRQVSGKMFVRVAP